MLFRSTATAIPPLINPALLNIDNMLKSVSLLNESKKTDIDIAKTTAETKQIEAQNRLASAETAKTLAEANKIAGVDTKGQDLENKWQEIENRIQLSKENIAAANVTEANANAQKAVELWNQEMLNTKYLNDTQEERVIKLVSEIALIQKEGAVQDSIVDVNYNTARKIQKEIENFYYDMITKRMSAEAAKEQAAAMIDKVAKDYELGKGHLKNENEKNLREWIYGGINQVSDIIGSISKFKQAQALIEKNIKKNQIMCYFTKKVLNKRFLPNRKNRWNPPVCTDERFRLVS